MGAIQRMMANDISCKHVAPDFSKKPNQRRLFPKIELTVVPSDGPAAEKRVRQAIVHLHELLLGHQHSIDHAEVELTYQLFAGILIEAKATTGLDKQGTYMCDRVDGHYLDDSHYTLRAWRAVITYLMLQHDFLYE